MTDGGFTLDKPEQIVAFAMLQVYHKLKLEVDHPIGPKWRNSPMKQAKHLMAARGVSCTKNTKAAVLAEYDKFLHDCGVLL